MRSLFKFALLLPIIGFAVIYILVMVTGSLIQFVVMVSVLVTAVFVWAPILGEWIERLDTRERR